MRRLLGDAPKLCPEHHFARCFGNCSFGFAPGVDQVRFAPGVVSCYFCSPIHFALGWQGRPSGGHSMPTGDDADATHRRTLGRGRRRRRRARRGRGASRGERRLGCEVRRDLREPREGAHNVHRTLRIASLCARRALGRGASRGELGRFLFRIVFLVCGLAMFAGQMINIKPQCLRRYSPRKSKIDFHISFYFSSYYSFYYLLDL